MGSQAVTVCARCQDEKKERTGPQGKASDPTQEDFLEEMMLKLKNE